MRYLIVGMLIGTAASLVVTIPTRFMFGEWQPLVDMAISSAMMLFGGYIAILVEDRKS